MNAKSGHQGCTQGPKQDLTFSCSGLLPRVGERSPQQHLHQRPTVLGDMPHDPDPVPLPALGGRGGQVYAWRQIHTSLENSALGQLTGVARILQQGPRVTIHIRNLISAKVSMDRSSRRMTGTRGVTGNGWSPGLLTQATLSSLPGDTQQCLKTFLVVTTGRRGSHWHVVGEDQGPCSTPDSAQDTPHQYICFKISTPHVKE